MINNINLHCIAFWCILPPGWGYHLSEIIYLISLILGFMGSWVQGFRGSRVQGFKGSGVPTVD
jgi:hypothetical protein